MHWYLVAWKQYFRLRGRARRREYWYFHLFYVLSVVLAVLLDMLTGTLDPHTSMGWLTVGLLLLSLPPQFAVSVRRLHDIGRSGWWVLLNLLPVLGTFTLAVLALFDSQPGANAFGPNPKERAPSDGAAAAPAAVLPDSSAKARPVWTRRAGIGAALVCLVAGGAWLGWQALSPAWLAEGRAHLERGKAAGRLLDERACVASALDALAGPASTSMAASNANSLELRGCLTSSRPTPELCEGVPAQSEILATGLWIADTCTRLGQGGNTACNTLVQGIAAYCNSDERASKLGRPAAGAV